MRKTFWIPSYYITVKKVVQKCISCRRFNERPIKLNQSPYRDFRVNPDSTVFSSLFIDFIGPFSVKVEKEKRKVYVLCFTCLWSRAVNLKVCLDLTVNEFLRAFQLHCFQYGVPQLCMSDLGTQIVAGGNIIQDFLKDTDTQNYFKEKGMKNLTFEQFDKGKSELGSLVESLVKITKRLIYGAIKNCILPLRQFEFFIEQTIHLANRRPIAFKEALRDGISVPDAITPEILIHGQELLSLNLIPELQVNPEQILSISNTTKHINDNYNQFQATLKRLKRTYHSEFLTKLIEQAVDRKDRYKIVHHKVLKVGDIVLLKEQFVKPNNYPMGIVRKITKNTKGEVTGASIFKGRTREVVKRHVSQLILLLSKDDEINTEKETNYSDSVASVKPIDPKNSTRVVSQNHDRDNPPYKDKHQEGTLIDSGLNTDQISSNNKSPIEQKPKRNAAIEGRKNIKRFLGIR